MREIKFRGLNGETGWHYGIPLTNKLGTYIIFEKNPHICSQYHYIEIDEFEVVKKETVSQWTGLLDKNDVEIYEGDIVKFIPSGEYGKVTSFGKSQNLGIEWENSKTAFFTPMFYLGCESELEIIGNIYENPELLEQEK
ncbi:YopX family protein [Aliarcobacter butzleri]|uniref:YopX family protein n=1 Tax=Aliarcobacter butzleri TaxID=28197 RepID=UPI001EDA92ED|nr:YopX family protein [Aliarcobacter butzleri]MCG3657945.1 YopX family protein [Aliarcobacter butzleri]